MIKASVELEDIDGLLDVQLAEVVAAIEYNLKEIAEDIRDNAKATSDFVDKTGCLRKSIKMKKSKFEDGGFIVYSKTPHTHLIEYGHVALPPGDLPGHRVPPHPFLRNSRDKGIRKAIELFRSNQ